MYTFLELVVLEFVIQTFRTKKLLQKDFLKKWAEGGGGQNLLVTKRVTSKFINSEAHLFYLNI